MVTRSKGGLCSEMKAQAAFSAKIWVWAQRVIPTPKDVDTYLARAVRPPRIHRLLLRHGAPGVLVVDLGVVPGIDHRAERGGQDDPADGRGVFCDGLEDAQGAEDGGFVEVFDGILDIEVVGGGGVDDEIQVKVTLNRLDMSMSVMAMH
jgi:hypothetical protein